MQRESVIALRALCRPQVALQIPWYTHTQQIRYASIKGSPQLPGVRGATPVTKKTISMPPKAQAHPSKIQKPAETAPRTSQQSRPSASSRPRQDPVHLARLKNTAGPTTTTSRGVNGELITHLPDVIWPGDTNTIELPDGRIMSFGMTGRLDPKRRMIPFVFETGVPGTRLDSWSFHRWGWNNCVPIISPDRPGMGHSTYVGNYSVVSHARDVRFLMHALGYKKYRVFGVSGGGPFALAIAALAPKSEVLGTGIMAGSAPVDASRSGSTLIKTLAEILVKLFPRWVNKHRERQVSKRMPYLQRRADELRGRRPETNDERRTLASLEELLRNGPKGHIGFFGAQNSYWGFELEVLRDKSPIHMAYGTEDQNTPIAGGRYMQERIGPNCTLTAIPGADHFTAQRDGNTQRLLTKLLKYK